MFFDKLLYYTARKRRLLNEIKYAIITTHVANTTAEKIANMHGISTQIQSAQSIIKIREIKDIPKAQKTSILVAFALDLQYS